MRVLHFKSTNEAVIAFPTRPVEAVPAYLVLRLRTSGDPGSVSDDQI